jgi:hypothetical protein
MKLRGIRSTAVLILLGSGCMSGEWRSTSADRPLSRNELASRDVTISSPDRELANAVAKAMASEGFRVVTHAPYHTQLELEVSVQRATGGLVAVATLSSDGFFVDEARAGNDVYGAAAAVAKTLAGSQAMADFVRNNGVPQQNSFGK